MKTKPDIKKLAVEIYKVALRGAGESVKDRIPWDDLDGHDKNALIAIARWHLREVKKAVDAVVW